MDDIRENLKKLMLAGLGAVAVAAEKTREAVDGLAKHGEAALEKTKAANEELKRVIKKKVAEAVPHAPQTPEEIDAWLDTLTPESRSELYEKLKSRDEPQI